MKKNIPLFIVLFILSSCGPKSQNKNLTYQNIVILSDLSSRLDNLPSKDSVEIHKIVEYFKNECVKPGEKIGDKSSITFAAFSEKVSAAIDLNDYKNLGDKQRFVNSTGIYKQKGLASKITDFEKAISNEYHNTRNDGLDLISLLIEKLNNEPIIKANLELTDGIDTTFINFDNNIYIFTDGYLEYKNKNENSQFYFSTHEIEKVRQYCIANKLNASQALTKDSSLGLPAYKSPKNQLTKLHVFETHERDKDRTTQTYSHAMGLRDNEILEAVWQKWAKDSGFKSFEWKKY